VYNGFKLLTIKMYTEEVLWK